MRQAAPLLLLLTAILAFVAIRPSGDATASTRGPGGIARRAVRCKTDGVKDTHVEVYNPATTEVTITVKVASTTGTGAPTEYTIRPMGLRRFDCNAASQLYGGTVKRAVMVVQSDSDVRIGGMFIAKFKSMPVPLPDGSLLSPVGQ